MFQSFTSKKAIWAAAFLLIAGTLTTVLAQPADASEFVVYSVFRGVDLGDGAPQPKDFYVNMGSSHGVTAGSTLRVYRRISTYDVTNEKLYKDMTFPIGELKVIHVEPHAAVTRLMRMYSPEETPALLPSAVMVGDIVTRK